MHMHFCITVDHALSFTFLIWKQYGLKFVFDGTQVYMAVARSFDAFSSSYAPDRTV